MRGGLGDASKLEIVDRVRFGRSPGALIMGHTARLPSLSVFRPVMKLFMGAGNAGGHRNASLPLLWYDPVLELNLQMLCSLTAPEDVRWGIR